MGDYKADIIKKNKMYNHLLYFSYWFVNSFIISLFSYLFPEDVILGSSKFSSLDGAIYSGFWVTFVVWIFWDYLLAKKTEWGKAKTFFWFWLANTIGLWATSQMGNFTGLHIVSIYLIIIVGLFANILQKGMRKFVINK